VHKNTTKKKEMREMKNHYYAWAGNEQGASTDVGHASSINDLAAQARHEFGSGWTIHIMRVDIDGDGKSVIGETEVKKFTIR